MIRSGTCQLSPSPGEPFGRGPEGTSSLGSSGGVDAASRETDIAVSTRLGLESRRNRSHERVETTDHFAEVRLCADACNGSFVADLGRPSNASRPRLVLGGVGSGEHYQRLVAEAADFDHKTFAVGPVAGEPSPIYPKPGIQYEVSFS